ncbi:MAG: hypothetical protein M5U22_06430 [Thermoleophilia bacterium]|nr:hypothetical protein [Thermoleophilia bacterium]
METRPEVLENALFPALAKVGHTAEGDIHTWSQGLGFHYANLLDALSEKATPAEKEAVLGDLWKFVASVGIERPNALLGVEKGSVDLPAIEAFMLAVMADRDHPAILGMGDSAEEAILNWVKTFAVVDFGIYTYLEKHLGSKRCMDIYMGLWETFALANLPHVKEAFGITDATPMDMDLIGKISQVYWEAIACPYKVTQHSNAVHEAEIEVCPYFENMKEILGEEKSRSMTLKCEAAVSVNYYDAILKALGVFDRYSFTMDKFSCCGDDVCRVRFEKR